VQAPQTYATQEEQELTADEAEHLVGKEQLWSRGGRKLDKHSKYVT
jgi:hypothetical protein